MEPPPEAPAGEATTSRKFYKAVNTVINRALAVPPEEWHEGIADVHTELMAQITSEEKISAAWEYTPLDNKLELFNEYQHSLTTPARNPDVIEIKRVMAYAPDGGLFEEYPHDFRRFIISVYEEEQTKAGRAPILHPAKPTARKGHLPIKSIVARTQRRHKARRP